MQTKEQVYQNCTIESTPISKTLKDKFKQDAQRALGLTETNNLFNPQFKAVAHKDESLHDFDITNLGDIRRAVYDKDIEIGDTFNLYSRLGRKDGCVWQGTLQKSLLNFLETYKQEEYRVKYIVNLLSLTKSDLKEFWSNQGIINLTYLSEHIEEYEIARQKASPREFSLVAREFSDVVDGWVKKGWGTESGYADIHQFTLTK